MDFTSANVPIGKRLSKGPLKDLPGFLVGGMSAIHHRHQRKVGPQAVGQGKTIGGRFDAARIKADGAQNVLRYPRSWGSRTSPRADRENRTSGAARHGFR